MVHGEMFIVGVYISHQHRYERPFYSDTLKQIKSVLDKAQQHDCVILLGDFNSRCGNLSEILYVNEYCEDFVD